MGSIIAIVQAHVKKLSMKLHQSQQYHGQVQYMKIYISTKFQKPFQMNTLISIFIGKHIARLETSSFDAFEVTVYEEHQKYNAANLLSDFGGTAGVFLGASFISIIELLAFMLHILIKKFGKQESLKE